jgi:hypothetical protein
MKTQGQTMEVPIIDGHLLCGLCYTTNMNTHGTMGKKCSASGIHQDQSRQPSPGAAEVSPSTFLWLFSKSFW